MNRSVSRYVLTNCRLIDGTGSEPSTNTTIVIEDERIAGIYYGGSAPFFPDAEILDLAGRTVMPGLIDAHTHITYHRDEYSLILQQMTESLESNTLTAAANARHILEGGCTAIGDGACRGAIGSAIRDAVASGLIKGPKVVAAGQMISGSGGIGDHTAAWGLHENQSYLGVTANGVDEIRSVVRAQLRRGVDWVKVTASGTPGNTWIGGDVQDLNYQEMRAAVAEAAKFGKSVHAHAHDRQGIKDAVRAGVISIHSGEFADEVSLELMAKTGCVFVPTLSWLHFRVNDEYCRAYLRSGQTREADVRKFKDACQRAFDAGCRATLKALEIGATIGIGSDGAHVFPPYDVALEMKYIQDLGVPSLKVIQAGTQNSAIAVGRRDRWGTVHVDKDADLLIVDGDPSNDIAVLLDKSKLLGIMQSGRFVKRSVDMIRPS